MSAMSTLEPPATCPQSLVDEPLFEIVDGKLVELPPMSIFSNRIAGRMYSSLDSFAVAHSLGTVVIEAILILDPSHKLQRRPDVAFVSRARWPLERDLPEFGEWEVVPNLAIEVISPNDLSDEVVLKKNEYFRLGVEQVWIVYPSSAEVHIWESPKQCRVLSSTDELEGGKLFPGFHLPLAPLFQRHSLTSGPKPD